MTKIPTEPNSSTIGGQVTLTGAASTHAALADTSFDSYIDIPRADLRQGTTSSPGSRYADADLLTTLGFPQPTPESGAVLTNLSYEVVAARIGGSGEPDPPFRWLRVFREDGAKASESKVGNLSVLSVGSRSVTTLPASPQLRLRGGIYDLGKKSTDKAQNKYDTRPRSVRVYSVTYFYTYVNKPEITVTAPVDSSTQSSASAPNISWTQNKLDSDGGAATKYQVKIFATPSGGWTGFNATTNTTDRVYNFAGTGTNTLTHSPTVNLINGTYRVYVRIAQVVNNADHWSDWSYTGFTVTTDRPGVPTSVSATADDTNGRITLSATKVAAGAGVAATDFIQIQRSTDAGTTWEDIRTDNGQGRVTAGSGATTYHDYEVGNGQDATYRVRGVKTYAEEVGTAYSDWSTATTATAWESTDWWLKDPLLPSRNITVLIESMGEETRAARQGVFQPIGSDKPIVVSDTRASLSGSVTFLVQTDEDKEALDTLISNGSPLLLQGISGHHWPDRYVILGDYARTRAGNKAWVEASLDATSWVEVEAPSGNIGE